MMNFENSKEVTVVFGVYEGGHRIVLFIAEDEDFAYENLLIYKEMEYGNFKYFDIEKHNLF